MESNLTLQDFKGAIGKEFIVGIKEGKRTYRILPGKRDIITEVNEQTGDVIGNYLTAHYTLCRFPLEQPEHLKKKSN